MSQRNQTEVVENADNPAIIESTSVAEAMMVPAAPVTPVLSLQPANTPLSRATPPSKRPKLELQALEGLELADIETEDKTITLNGKEVTRKVAVTIKGYPVRLVPSNRLRKVCTLLKVTGYKKQNERRDIDPYRPAQV
jgi:hypothetical protein